MTVGTAAFEAAHAEGVAALCAELGWTSYADPALAERGLLAPGVVTRVALEGEHVVGFAQACGDGVVQSFLAQAFHAAFAHRRKDGFRVYPGLSA